MRLLLAVALGIVAFGCGSSGGSSSPCAVAGLLGCYDLKAKPIMGQCQVAGPPLTEYAFLATLAVSSDGGRYVLTTTSSDGQFTDKFDAGFDGQFASFAQTQTGSFGLVDGGSCAPCEMTFTQTGRFALLSPSQATGDMCPANPLTGDVTTNEDAGIFAPQPAADGGLDAVRVCGEITAKVVGEGVNCDPNCFSCNVVYRVTGSKH